MALKLNLIMPIQIKWIRERFCFCSKGFESWHFTWIVRTNNLSMLDIFFNFVICTWLSHWLAVSDRCSSDFFHYFLLVHCLGGNAIYSNKHWCAIGYVTLLHVESPVTTANESSIHVIDNCLTVNSRYHIHVLYFGINATWTLFIWQERGFGESEY